MVEVTAVAAITGILRTARDGLRALRQSNLADEHKRVVESALDQLIDAQDRIGDVQAESIELREKNAELRRQIDEYEDWQARFDPYRLITTDGGAHVYCGSTRQGEPEHYVCPACTETRSIQILQDQRNMAGTFACPSCNAKYRVKPGSRARQGQLLRS